MPSSKSKAPKASTNLSTTQAPIYRLFLDVWVQVASYLPPNALIHLLLAGDKRLSNVLSQITTFKTRWELLRFPDLNRLWASSQSLFRSTEHFYYKYKLPMQLTPQFDWRNRFSSLKTLNLHFYGCLESVTHSGPINALWPLLEDLTLEEPSEAPSRAYSTFFNLLELPKNLRVLSILTPRSMGIIPHHFSRLPTGLEVFELHNQCRFVSCDPKASMPNPSKEFDGTIFELPSFPPTLRSLVLNRAIFNGIRITMSRLPPSLTFLSFLGYITQDATDDVTCNIIDWKTDWTKDTIFNVSTLKMPHYTITPEIAAFLPPSITRLDCALLDPTYQGPIKFDKRLFRSVELFFGASGEWMQSLLEYTNLTSLNITTDDNVVLKQLPTPSLQTLFVTRVCISALPPNLTSLTFGKLTFPEPIEEVTSIEPRKGPVEAHDRHAPQYSFPPSLTHLDGDHYYSSSTINDNRVILALPPSIKELIVAMSFDCFKLLHEQSLLGRFPYLVNLNLHRNYIDPSALGMIPSSLRKLKMMLNAVPNESHKPALKCFRSRNLESLKYYYEPNVGSDDFTYSVLKYLPQSLKSLEFAEYAPRLPKSVPWPSGLTHLSINSQHTRLPLPLPKYLTSLNCAATILPKKVSALPLYITRFHFRISRKYFEEYQCERNNKLIAAHGYENLESSGNLYLMLIEE